MNVYSADKTSEYKVALDIASIDVKEEEKEQTSADEVRSSLCFITEQ